jgi:hypothetical protein
LATVLGCAGHNLEHSSINRTSCILAGNPKRFEVNMDEELKRKMQQLKPKKKLAVPEEFLETAKSYEDKQMLVQILAEKEKSRVVLLVKSMLKAAVAARDKK